MDIDLSLSNDEENNNINFTQGNKLNSEANNRITKSLEKRKIKKKEDKDINLINNEKEELIKMIEELEEAIKI